jgi:hypothetical protein
MHEEAMSDEDEMAFLDYFWMVFRVLTLSSVGMILFHEGYILYLLCYIAVIFFDHFSVEIS